MSVTPDPASGDVNVTQAQRWQLLEQLNRKSLPAFLPALVLLSLVAVLGLVGNALVLHVYGRKLKAGTTRCFVLSLALVDLLSCTVGAGTEAALIRFTNNFEWDDLCKVITFTKAAPTLASGFLVLAMTVERYKRLCWITQRPIGERRARLMVVVACILGGITAAPYLVLSGTLPHATPWPDINASQCSSNNGRHHPHIHLAYAGFLLLAFLACFATLIGLYMRIALTVWRRRFVRDAALSCNSLHDLDLAQDTKARCPTCCGENAGCFGSISCCGCCRCEGCCACIDKGTGSLPTEEEDATTCCLPEPCGCGRKRPEAASKSDPEPPVSDDADTGIEVSCFSSQSADVAAPGVALVCVNRTCWPSDPHSVAAFQRYPEVTTPRLPRKESTFPKSNLSDGVYSLAAALHIPSDLSIDTDRTQTLTSSPISPSDDVSSLSQAAGAKDLTLGSRQPGSRRGSRRGKGCASPALSRKTASTRSISRVGANSGRTTLIIFVIGIVLILSYVPFLIVTLVRDTKKNFLDGLTVLEEQFYNLFLRSYFIQAMANPIIYSFLNVRFRAECAEIFRRKRRAIS